LVEQVADVHAERVEQAAAIGVDLTVSSTAGSALVGQ
jgi:hypothetical protein